jgi:cytochrome c oxidase subunit II
MGEGRDAVAQRRRRWLAWTALLGVVLAGCATEGLPQSAMDPAGPVARTENSLWNYVFTIAVVVFILVQGLILFAVFRYRDRGGDEIPKQVAGNTRLELLWTFIPAAILVAIAVPTVSTIFDLAADPGDEALDVRVVAKQYWWEFEYQGDEGQGVVVANELHIPTDRPVFLSMQSLSAITNDEGLDAVEQGGDINAGVLHSFWVPRLAGKQDVVPGHTRRMTIQADEPGVYPGQCAEFCGLSHARMRFEVIAHEPAEFESWLAAQSEPAQPASDQLAQEGEALFGQDQLDQQCITCHAINGYETTSGGGATIRVGPNLTHFASRRKFAGGTLDVSDEEQIKAWLRDPQAEKAGAQMPDLNLSEDHIDALTAYLQSLE